MTKTSIVQTPAIDATHFLLMHRLARSHFEIDMLSHQPQGNTVLASDLRGHSLADAIKTIVVRVKITRKKRRYVLAVVCGHRRVNLDKVARCFGGVDARFADPATAFALTGCVSGSVMPLCLHDEVPVIADFEVLERATLWFNSGRLDHSVGLRTADWVALARPRLEAIAEMDPENSLPLREFASI